MKYLLDTDICIYWLKGNTTVRDKFNQVNWTEIAICVITASELYFGAYNSNKIAKNLKTAETFIQSLIVLPLSNNTIKKFGQLKTQLRQVGTPVADFDLLIASVALTENLILVTNNTRHYQRIVGLKLDNWSVK
ncbi:PilT protein domain protein [Stanieria cyanosphaera PCC 7437]|uniref:PilT protein domain protein n=1 Tax=Stanieria cyanosphaera (strain ATCC 29371 / PCC 7437) TaxID=111780 RepID=K9XSB2_STAC7|nr:type II toxin-antitoxin system VapC family toxin [Stanieria cyanosphaera]AFZ34951.1 PilT protein domain protein [Stanieria cyanosphaera PCC 7437]